MQIVLWILTKKSYFQICDFFLQNIALNYAVWPWMNGLGMHHGSRVNGLEMPYKTWASECIVINESMNYEWKPWNLHYEALCTMNNKIEIRPKTKWIIKQKSIMISHGQWLRKMTWIKPQRPNSPFHELGFFMLSLNETRLSCDLIKWYTISMNLAQMHH